MLLFMWPDSHREFLLAARSHLTGQFALMRIGNILGDEQMSSRNRTQEILDVKQRDARWTWFGPHGLESLQQDWLKNRGNEACKPDFYLIRTVTLPEVFARRNLADLIDHDKRFTDRAIEFSKQIKIDFALIRDIQGRTITLGDILSTAYQ